MRFYGLSWKDTLDLPLVTFWMLSRNVDRLRAEEDIRSLQVSAAAQAPKAYDKAERSLRKQMGEVFRSAANTGLAGVAKLRAIFKKA